MAPWREAAWGREEAGGGGAAEGSPELWASSGQLAERTGKAAASHATLNKCDRVPRHPSADQEQSDKILKTGGGGHVTGWGYEPPRPGIQAWRPDRPRRLGSKMTKTLMPPGVRIMSPTHPRRCAATGAPNAPERPCRDDAEQATTRVSKRDRDAALLRLQHVPRWRRPRFWFPFLRF